MLFDLLKNVNIIGGEYYTLTKLQCHYCHLRNNVEEYWQQNSGLLYKDKKHTL